MEAKTSSTVEAEGPSVPPFYFTDRKVECKGLTCPVAKEKPRKDPRIKVVYLQGMLEPPA